MQKISRLSEALTREIHHRTIIGFLAVLVLLIHLWTVVFLLQPTGQDNVAKPIKVMEVVLVKEPTPEKEAAPPAPPKPAPAKIVPPKKKAVIPPVKKKVPVIPKQEDLPKLKPRKLGDDQIPIPNLSPSDAVKKPQMPMPTSQSTLTNKPATKSGNGDAKSKGVNSGVVELGCPKPKYPNRAMSRHIEGSVRIEMTISASGAVANAAVVSSQPPGIFEDTALDAAKRCKFKPKIANGIPVQLKTSKTFRFSLVN